MAFFLLSQHSFKRIPFFSFHSNLFSSHQPSTSCKSVSIMAIGSSSSSCSFSKCCFFYLLLLFLWSSVKSSETPHAKDSGGFETREIDREKEQLFPSIHRALIEYFRNKMTEFDSIDPPTTALPSAPLTNPVTASPISTAPGIVTVPGTNTGGVSPVPTTTTPTTTPVNPPVPVTNPVNSPVPISNPVNSPVPVTNPVNSPVPISNPVNSPTPVTNPVTTPSTNPGAQPTVNPGTTPSTPSGGNVPAGRGQSWCIAKNGASQAVLQSALDYACGIGGADCATIQQGSSCYEPATLQNHASYAFNSYYQKNPSPTSCDFGGAAAITTTNPSTGSCVYPSSSSSSSSSSSPTTPVTPTTQTPNNPTSLPTPTTISPGSTFPGTQSPPPGGFSLGNPDPTGLGAFGASPPLVNNASVSNNLRPFIGCLVLVASIILFGL